MSILLQTKDFKELEEQLADSRRNVRETLQQNQDKLNSELSTDNNESPPGVDENAEDAKDIKKRAEEAVKKANARKAEETVKQAEATLAANEEAEKAVLKQAAAEKEAAALAEKENAAEAEKKAAAEAEKEAAAQAAKEAAAEAEKEAAAQAAANAQAADTEAEVMEDLNDEPPAVPEDL